MRKKTKFEKSVLGSVKETFPDNRVNRLQLDENCLVVHFNVWNLFDFHDRKTDEVFSRQEWCVVEDGWVNRIPRALCKALGRRSESVESRAMNF